MLMPSAAAACGSSARASGASLAYTVTVPSGRSQLKVTLAGGSGDADLYVRQGAQPTTSQYTCRPYLTGNNEVCTINNPQAGTWHVGIRAYTAFSGVTFSYQY